MAALAQPFSATSTTGVTVAFCKRSAGIWSQQRCELEGREASPTAGVIDSQSVKTTESGEIRGFDAGKRIKGRKRHILTDTLGIGIGGSPWGCWFMAWLPGVL